MVFWLADFFILFVFDLFFMLVKPFIDSHEEILNLFIPRIINVMHTPESSSSF